MREFRVRAARLGMATGAIEPPAGTPSRKANAAAAPILWALIGLGAAAWLVVIALGPGGLSLAPPADDTPPAPAVTASAPPVTATDRRLARIEARIDALRRSNDHSTAVARDLARRVETIEGAFAPVTGSLGDRPGEPSRSAPGKSSAPATERAPAALPRRAAIGGADEAAPMLQPAFAVDLGGFDRLDEVSDRWAVLAAKFAPLLGDLVPRAVTNVDADGARTFRLIAGPFDDIAETARLCRELSDPQVDCAQTMFVGEPL